MELDLQLFISKLEKEFTVLDQPLMPDASYTDLPAWDSLTALMILDMIDDQYDVGLTGVELRDCSNVQALYDLIISKKR